MGRSMAADSAKSARERPLIELVLGLINDDSGATAVEYSLIAVFVSIAAIGGMSALGVELKDLFTGVSSVLDNALTGAGF